MVEVMDRTHPSKWKFEPEAWFSPGTRTVECSSCRAEHDLGSEGFVAYYGNVMVGINGGMVGNNIDGGAVKRVTVMCRDSGCHENLLRAICPDLYAEEEKG
jgi:hypothetical protein